jgi:hypothetical protein
MFSISHSHVTRMSSGSKRKSKPRLIVALRIARGVELKTSLLDFLPLPDPMQGVIPCPLSISRNS